VQVTTEGSGQTIYRLGGTAKKATKNGYVYIYVSNESDNLVYFDNLQVTHEHGPLLQEDHYYPYGLGMAGISSRAITTAAPNKYKANGGAEYGDKEWNNGSGLQMYETFYRSYNAQIGRFMQVDPLTESSMNISTYSFSVNNPAMFTDFLGDRYRYMDKNGTKWHHADVLAGTAMEGQQYQEGYGIDGFGNDYFAGSGASGGGGGSAFGVIDYTSEWESKIKGMVKNGVNAWDPVHGYYNTEDVANYGPEWKRMSEVIVSVNLQQRPDDDGYLTYGEANYWRHYGNGESLYVDINKLQFPSSFTVERFEKSKLIIQGHKAITVHFDGKDFVNPTQALVYGSVTFVMFSDKTVMAAYPDTYNFDLKLSRGTFFRDWATVAGNLMADFAAATPGKPFLIWIGGFKKISAK
jgi:RHS repeat-associated protein